MIRLTTEQMVERTDYLRWMADLYDQRAGWLDDVLIQIKMWRLAIITFVVTAVILACGLWIPMSWWIRGVLILAWLVWMAWVLVKRCSYDIRLNYAIRAGRLKMMGIELVKFFDSYVFERLAFYTEFKGDFGVAILNMFVLRNNGTARFVVAKFKGSETPRAFVEFRVAGLWWVLDMSDGSRDALRLRMTHSLRYHVQRYQMVPHGLFWNLYCVQKSYDVLHGFDPHRQSDDMAFFYQLDKLGRTMVDLDNPKDGPRKDRPVTKEIIEDYLEKASRLFPKRKTYHAVCAAEKERKQPKRFAE